MKLILLNENLEQIKILDQYESFIWTDRYREAGDFEYYTVIDFSLIDILRLNDVLYVWSSESDHIMMVEQYDISTSFDDGSKIAVTGRSAEAILDRRIVWSQTKLSGNFQEAIKKLIDDAIIAPANESRKISNFIFEMSNDPKITELTIEETVRGDNLYDLIRQLCKDRNIGFRVYLNSQNQFVFNLYSGVDRSYLQTSVPYVIFSSDFQNLGSSNYTLSRASQKNVVGIAKEEDTGTDSEGNPNPPSDFMEYNPSSSVGIRRKEMMASDMYKANEGATEEENQKVFDDIGNKNLKDNKREELFEGQVSMSDICIYGRDFFIGDIVQVKNEYGIESDCRIIEIVMNKDQDTYEIYPTFEAVEDE